MLWRQEPCPAFESTFDVGNWYRATTETDTQTAKDPNENAQRAKNNSSATCATSGDKENESDWETCSDCSTDSDNETNKIIRGKEDVREDVTETLQENTLLVLVQYIGLWSSLCKVIPSETERMDLYIMVAAILELTHNVE
ncbi:hypothetical protein DAPPUDRAFT_251277 [Daphnia pulex]|uniref:Uncharacterized protein n=1 Tax=Daphnia pulex TaxID=6669 RepID=E9H034_DAPPU|nr:hypothetical protein DAPPUDRAFT_251277 [Daphnia pulex]|eukprot:EFX74952.1 hypothetical protein DAPPUDRAFT_251277 [Daphnia pulex]